MTILHTADDALAWGMQLAPTLGAGDVIAPHDGDAAVGGGEIEGEEHEGIGRKKGKKSEGLTTENTEYTERIRQSPDFFGSEAVLLSRT